MSDPARSAPPTRERTGSDARARGADGRDPKTRGWVVIHEEECKGCTLCIAVCPSGCLEVAAHLNHQGYHPIHYKGDGCRADGLCFYACPEPGAISVFEGNPDDRPAD